MNRIEIIEDENGHQSLYIVAPSGKIYILVVDDDGILSTIPLNRT